MEVIDIRPVLLPGKIQHLYHLLHFSKTQELTKEFNQSSDCAFKHFAYIKQILFETYHSLDFIQLFGVRKLHLIF